VLALLAGAAGCGHDKPKPDESTAAAVDDGSLGSSDDGKAMGLQTVHFAYDSFLLDSATRAQLEQNAGILKAHPTLHVQIEGHCDQRGGIQYNIALGDKRANAVRKYLDGLGVTDGQLSTISYGKERPLATGDDEASYAKNRRANFVVTSK
jgi:peptidoglycan-associated lipoprotein